MVFLKWQIILIYDNLQFDNYLQYKMRRDQNGENFNSKVIDLSNSNFFPPVLKLKDV